jgi:hypothetical protein
MVCYCWLLIFKAMEITFNIIGNSMLMLLYFMLVKCWGIYTSGKVNIDFNIRFISDS